MIKNINIQFEEFENIEQAPQIHKKLIEAARLATKKAYAPYSNFSVGAAALLSNQFIVSSANQENAAYPVGICAERALLSTISSMYINETISCIALAYNNLQGASHQPLSPCGMCRQCLVEYEDRMNKKIPMLLCAMQGNVILVSSCRDLLPFAFDKSLL